MAFVCICNQFNDKAVQDYIEQEFDGKTIPKNKIMEIYRAASGGVKPQCGKCIKSKLEPIIEAHNNALA